MGGEPEVISHGRHRDPWRPSRRLIAIGAVLAALLTGLAFGGHEVQARRAQDAATARAARVVVLDVTQDEGTLDLILRNESGTELTIKSASLDFPRTELVPSADELGRFGSVSLGLGPPACDEKQYDQRPSEVVVEATTLADLRVTRHVSLGSDAQDYLWRQLRQVCRMLPPDEALQSTVVSSTLTAGLLRVTYGLRNTGLVPLSLVGVTYVPGVTVKTQPATLTLEPVPDTGPITDTRLVVELRISSCELLERALNLASGGDGLDGPGSLKPQLRHAHGSGGGFLILNNREWVPFLSSCRSVVPYWAGYPTH